MTPTATDAPATLPGARAGQEPRGPRTLGVPPRPVMESAPRVMTRQPTPAGSAPGGQAAVAAAAPVLTPAPAPVPVPVPPAAPLPPPVAAPGPDLTHFARLHESLGRDLVYRYRIGATRGFDYISPSCLAVTGYTQAEHLADPNLPYRLVLPDDRTYLGSLLSGMLGPRPCVLRLARRDGTVIWTEHHTTLVHDAAGVPVAVEGIARDVTELALATDALRAADAGTRAFMETAPNLAVIVDPAGRLMFANPAFLELTGWGAEEVVGRDWAACFLRRAGATSDGRGFLGLTDSWHAGRDATAPLILRDGRRHMIRWSNLGIFDARGCLTAIASMGEDITAIHERAASVARLSAAVERTGDAVVITDTDARIVYVNDAFERSTGYTREEALGGNPRILQSGHQTDGFYRAMWWTLTRGRTWRGELVNRRKDGSLLIEEASITPITGADGATTAYVAVKRDVTGLRSMRANLDDATRRQEVLAAALERLVPRDTVAQTCGEIADVLRELPGTIAAGVALAGPRGVVRLVAVASTTPIELAPGEALPEPVAARLRDGADALPWIEHLAVEDGGDPDCPVLDAGIRSLLIAPIRRDGRLLGALIVGGTDVDGADIRDLAPTLSHVAAVARTILGPGVETESANDAVRERVASIIAERAFRPVFQPIVNLETGLAVGFEALTRFDAPTPGGATPAGDVFRDAALVGLGRELETATLRASLAAARDLPLGAWLSVNVSPSLACDGLTLPEIMAGQVRETVLEITEHEEIGEYEALRAVLGALGPAFHVAVDDVGAGIANFRHLVELRPDYVKLDVSLVRGIDADLTRQALILGLKHFAQVSGRALVAEGIETEAERDALVSLDVRLGQGYLLGRPTPVEHWAIVAPEEPAASLIDEDRR